MMRFVATIGILVLSSVPATPQIPAAGSISGRGVLGSGMDPIVRVRQQWVRSFSAKDLNGLIALYADDAALLLPSGERLSGKDKITAHFKELFNSTSTLAIRLDSEKVETSSDLGYDSGKYEETVRQGAGSGSSGPGGRGGVETKHFGNYLAVLRHRTGNWLIVQQAVTEVPNK